MSGTTRARRHDRLLFLRSHPVLYPALSLLSRRPISRVGSVAVVSDPDMVREVLLHAPLDRTGAGTTGALVRQATGTSTLFAADGDENRALRVSLVQRLNDPRMLEVFEAGIAPLCDRLGSGGPVDAAPALRGAAGATAAALLGLAVDPGMLMEHIDALVDAGARAQLGGRGDVLAPARALVALLEPGRWHDGGLLGSLAADHGEEFAVASGAVAAVAAATTTVAAGTRAIAWCADADEWDAVQRDPDAAASRCLGVLTPSPLLPRRLRDDYELDGRRLTSDMRLLLNLRAACRAGDDQVRNLAFGFGPFACPGAALARRQLSALLAGVGAHGPRVVSRSVGKGRALPRWDRLVLEARR